MTSPSNTPRSTRARGLDAELLAAEHLMAHGLTIIARNFNARCGELDLVCTDSTFLVIVEVRQRADARFGGAMASITAAKQRRIIRATHVFLQRHPCWRRCRIRFDAIGVDGDLSGGHRITWIRDAFRPG